jgi:hypothetical protein
VEPKDFGDIVSGQGRNDKPLATLPSELDKVKFIPKISKLVLTTSGFDLAYIFKLNVEHDDQTGLVLQD